MLLSKKSILTLYAALLAVNSFSQDLESWNIYSSFSTVNAMALDDKGVLYASTLGGIFSIENGELLNTYTTIDGMHRLDPSFSVFDESNGKIIYTYPDGVVDVFDIESGIFQKNEDIARVQQFASKKINELIVSGSNLFVATDFGVVIYSLNDFFVTSSVLKLGSFTRGIKVNDLDIAGDSLYVATDEGVAIASLNSNLLNSDSWKTYSESDGFGDQIVNKIVAHNTSIYAISGGSTYNFDGTSWNTTSEFGNSVFDFYKNGEDLFIISDQQIIKRDAPGSDEILTIDSESSILSVIKNGNQIFVGTSDEGVFLLDITDRDSDNQFIPGGPYLNFFSELSFVNNTLLSTSTAGFPSFDPLNPVRGYYLFNDGEWKNFNIRTNEEMTSFNFGTVYSLSSTSTDYYFGGWGDGIIKHNIETNELTIFDHTNTELTGIAINRNYIVISGLSADKDDNMWAISYDSNTPLNLQVSGSEEWLHFSKVPIPSDNLYFDLFIDSNDQKWITLADFNRNGKGLLVLDTKGNTNPTDDEYRHLTSDDNNGNLPNELITSIVEDKDGEIWIGTERGIARFIFPEFIIESTNPNDYQAQWLINEDTSAISRFLLRDVNVSAMAVNESNQKWIGSVNQGLWLLNGEGSRIVKRFTKDNSPLISNNILSITIDDETGEVFIATDLGLISYTDLAITPNPQMDDLKVYPNPFLYSQHSRIVIEGLSESTDIKVLGVDGTVVRELETRGGRVSWDGLDYNGNELGTGVYFVVALDKNGSEKGIGKVAIIR